MPTATQAPVQMTRAQYQAKYGSPPPLPAQATASRSQSQSVSMTRAQYQAKYGVAAPSPTSNGTTPAIPTGSAGQSSGTPDPSKNPLTFATNLTNALGLKGTTDTFGGDIAAAANPDLVQKGLLQVPSAEQNAGAVLQTGAIAATPFIGPEGILANIGTGAALGAAQTGGQAMTGNAPVQKVAQQSALGALLGGVASGIASGASSLADALGNKISNTVIKPSAKDINDGFTTDTIKKYNLGGSLDQTAAKIKSTMTDLVSQLKAKLGSSTAGIDLASVFDKTKSDLLSPKGTMGNSVPLGQGGGVDRQLAQLEDEVLRKNPTGQLSIPDAQTVKQEAGMNGEWSNGYGTPDADAKATVYNAFYHNLKTEIEDKSPPGVEAINAQIQDLIPAQRAVARRIPIADRNSGIGLRDMMGLVGIATGHPEAAIPLALERASNSGIFGNVLWNISQPLRDIAPSAGLGASTQSGLLSKK